MKTGIRPTRLSRFRHQARKLLKELRSETDADAARAAERFRRLRSFAGLTDDELRAEPERVRLKHALTVLALENGHQSWPAFKAAVAAGEPPAGGVEPGREWYEDGMAVLLNQWFARYDDARATLAKQGGYLFPYAHQFFICEDEGVRILGLDPDDPDWRRIGHDAAKPADPDAWRRLRIPAGSWLGSISTGATQCQSCFWV